MTGSMTKADLVTLLFQRMGLNKTEAKCLVDAFFHEICNALARGESVRLSNFGHFQIRQKSARPGRNPKTGQSFPIHARRVVSFQPSQKLKTAVEQ